jgi:hypothetical protein
MPATKEKPAVESREALLAEQQRIAVQLHETDEAERLRLRKEWAAELAKLTLPPDTSIGDATAKVKRVQDELEAARRDLRVLEANRTTAALSMQAQSGVLANRLRNSASQQIGHALAELERKRLNARDRRQSFGGKSNARAVDGYELACQSAQRQLGELTMLPLTEAEVESAINKLFRGLPREKFPMIDVSPPAE